MSYRSYRAGGVFRRAPVYRLNLGSVFAGCVRFIAATGDFLRRRRIEDVRAREKTDLDFAGKKKDWTKLSTSLHRSRSRVAAAAPLFLKTASAYFSCLAGYSWFYNDSLPSARGFLSLWVLHFARRGLESLFLAKYERPNRAVEIIGKAVYYAGLGALNGWWMNRSEGVATLGINYLGVAMFILGEAGNFYHHYKLATLRPPGKQGYTLPTGAGFDYVVMPHYGFEILSWIGWCLSSKSFNIPALVLLALSFAALYPRAKARKQKYVSMFDGKDGRPKYDPNMKLMIPFII